MYGRILLHVYAALCRYIKIQNHCIYNNIIIKICFTRFYVVHIVRNMLVL